MPRLPTIIIPFAGPCHESQIQDIALYLKPEANKLEIESALIKVLHNSPNYKTNYRVVYLANIPGDFIRENKIIEKHNSLQIYFAEQDKNAFTEVMKQQFENHFQVPFAEADIIGAFAALSRLNMTADELFHTWVDEKDFLKIHDQTIKKFKDIYIVNYDVPAILTNNNQSTNVFAMLLRSYLPYSEIRNLIDEMGKNLKAEYVIDGKMPISYVFHYSKSPFEQILDGMGYIYHKDIKPVKYEDISFFNYLLRKDCDKEEILHDIKNPIMRFYTPTGIREENLLTYTHGDSFESAFLKYKSKLTLSTTTARG